MYACTPILTAGQMTEIVVFGEGADVRKQLSGRVLHVRTRYCPESDAGGPVAERVSRGGAIVLEIIGSVEHNALGVGPN